MILSMFLLAVALLQFATHSEAQDCLLATNGERHLPTFVRPGGGKESGFRNGPIQAIIISYRFNCCGVVTEWRAFVERSGGGHFRQQPYTISFQVWRPNSPSPVDTDGCYTMAGVNHFSPISLADNDGPDRGVVTGRPVESERIEVQPGDVVGFYLVSTRNDNDGIQFARDGDNTSPYRNETVWFATGSINSGGPPTCPFPVGTSGTLSSSTNRAPLITATVSMSDCPVATTVQPSTTRHISIPTPTPSPPSHKSPTSTSMLPIATLRPTSGSVEARADIALYVGIAVSVNALVVGTVLVLLGIVRCVVKKRRTKDIKDEDSRYYINDLPSDIPTSQNPAYGDTPTTTADDLGNYYVNDGLAVGVKIRTNQPSYGSDHSIPTTKTETYVNVSADTERVDTEDTYDYVMVKKYTVPIMK